MAKPKTPSKLRPHAQRVRRRLVELLGRKRVQIAAGPQAGDEITIPMDVMRLFMKGHADVLSKPYFSALNQISVLAELLLGLPELRRFSALFNDAHEEYMPSWPPMSPISHSHFTCWSFFDAAIGPERETIGTIVLDLADNLPVSAELVWLVENLRRSRMGLFVREGQVDDLLWLRELGTGIRRRCVVANGYAGAEGEFWLARLLPSPVPVTDIHVVLTSPYIVLDPGEAAWLAFFERTLSKTGLRDQQGAFEHLMKYGLGPKYWLEYIFHAYAGDTDLTLWLRGLPDVAESLPHASMDWSSP